jgi:hypothetical protein
MIFSENRFTRFRIMLWQTPWAIPFGMLGVSVSPATDGRAVADPHDEKVTWGSMPCSLPVHAGEPHHEAGF